MLKDWYWNPAERLHMKIQLNWSSSLLSGKPHGMLQLLAATFDTKPLTSIFGKAPLLLIDETCETAGQADQCPISTPLTNHTSTALRSSVVTRFRPAAVSMQLQRCVSESKISPEPPLRRTEAEDLLVWLQRLWRSSMLCHLRRTNRPFSVPPLTIAKIERQREFMNGLIQALHLQTFTKRPMLPYSLGETCLLWVQL